jgi:hypothetical protein
MSIPSHQSAIGTGQELDRTPVPIPFDEVIGLGIGEISPDEASAYERLGHRCRHTVVGRDHVTRNNLIAEQRIPPMVALLVGNVPGQRDSELPCNPPFFDFLNSERLPWPMVCTISPPIRARPW